MLLYTVYFQTYTERTEEMALHTQPTVSIPFTNMVLTYCKELGIDIGDLIKSAAIDSRLLEDPEERIDYVQFSRLFCEAEKRSGVQHFGLLLGKRAIEFSGGHILISMMQSCATIGDALERVLRYHSLASDAFSFSAQKDGNYTVVALREDGLVPRLPSSEVEQIISMLVLILSSLSGRMVRPVGINFRHRRPNDIHVHIEIFGACVSFGKKCDEIRLSTECLLLPLPNADSGFQQTIERLVDKRLKSLFAVSTWAARAERQLIQTLTKGDAPGFDALATNLAMSGKTLRRYLKSEGTTFKLILDAVREEMAKTLLGQPGMSLFDVALLLGYSEQSTFNHAFRRWTGMSPRDFIREQGATENNR